MTRPRDTFDAPEFEDEEIQKLWDDALENADPAGLSSEELDHLVHTLVARRLVELLQHGRPSPGTLNAALRFLKDNDITALPIPGSASAQVLEKIKDTLPFRRKAE